MKKAIIRDFDKAAKSYDEYAKLQRIVADKLFAMADFKAEQLVLDAGCGTGYFHELLRKNKIYCPLIQADISFNMCKKADEYASPKEYGGTYTINADISNLPIADESLDAVFSSMTLQWVDDLLATFGEIRRTLKDGGKFIFSTVGDGSLIQLSKTFAALDSASHTNNFQTEQLIKSQLVAAGFADVTIKSETITEYFTDVSSILCSIKGVGASYKAAGRKYLGKEYFIKAQEQYSKHYRSDKGLPLSWNIIYAVAVK